MDYSSAVGDLNSVKTELRSIIAEMEEISAGLRSDFCGIGTELCADSIGSVISNLRAAQNSLNKVDEGAVFRWFDDLRRQREAAEAARRQADADHIPASKDRSGAHGGGRSF